MSATREDFWLCEECDAVWLPGQDRSVANFFYLTDLLPEEDNPWNAIERAGDSPRSREDSTPSRGTEEAVEALLEVARGGRLAGLALGMHRSDALVVLGEPHVRAPGLVEAGDVSLAFEGDTLVGIAVRLRPGGVRWPGLTAAASPKPVPVPEAAALRALSDAGFGRRPIPSPGDRGADLWGDGRRVRLEFEDGVLCFVRVS
ncbi:hypothetical protein ACFY4C_16990 [Actinomadura viridis]|uniref:hypothetical protein n=1 Tax=Actinomadura viridis TaxID=58110 RepID=UPI0036824988